ncbi:unnamed protein product [Tuber aestivum]|uniref:Uncharacterized protein n=1 Tax=Tuber aestivum TaxID=59557 RepID=A0A292PKG1_9PEZI|nr:unnamed protein product [Tuber aestivum]
MKASMVIGETYACKTAKKMSRDNVATRALPPIIALSAPSKVTSMTSASPRGNLCTRSTCWPVIHHILTPHQMTKPTAVRSEAGIYQKRCCAILPAPCVRLAC